MNFKTIIKKHSDKNFNVFIIFLIFSAVAECQNPNYDCSGLYQSSDAMVSIIKVGEKNPSYLVRKNDELFRCSFVLNKRGDSLLFRKERAFILVNQQNRTITGIDDDKTYFFKDTVASLNIRSIKSKPNDFFDFSTDVFSAGYTFDLSPKAILPFALNRLFIETYKIDTLRIDLFDKTISRTSTIISKVANMKFAFNNFRHISGLNITEISDGKKTGEINWTYKYAKDTTLHSIKIETKVTGVHTFSILWFDKDGWLVDETNTKDFRNIGRLLFEYSYDGKSGMPIRAKAICMPLEYQPSISYVYNSENQLIKIEHHDPSSPSSKRSTEYNYNQQGILIGIVNVKEFLSE
jgi:hypothetical protein